MRRAGWVALISGAYLLAIALAARAAANDIVVRRTRDAEIQAVLADSIDAFNRGDFEKFLQLYAVTDDVAYVYGGQLWQGIEQIRRDYAHRFFSNVPASGRPLTERLSIAVSRIVELAPGVLLVTARVAPITNSTETRAPASVTTLVLRRIDGTWRVLYDHSS